MAWTARATVLILLGLCWSPALGSLTHSRAQNRNLQRAIHHERIFLVLEGVRERALNTVSPDALLLVDFPEIDNQFKVKWGTFIFLPKNPVFVLDMKSWFETN